MRIARTQFNLSFGFKLRLAISLVSVGVTAASVYLFYSIAQHLILNQMQSRLQTAGRLSTFLFDQDAKASIQRLKRSSEQSSIAITPEIFQMLQPGEAQLSLSPSSADRLMQSADFQQLVQILRRISESSRPQLPVLFCRFSPPMFWLTGGGNPSLNYSRRLKKFNQLADLDIAGFMESADEVGSDYYDVLYHDDRIKIGIGDVTGHGLESGVLMIIVQTAVRTLLANNETDPRRLLNTINQVIYDNAQRMESHKTLSLALLDHQAGRVKLSGQHEEMLVVRSDGQIERIDTVDLGFFLGLLPDITDFITEVEVQLQPGDGMVLYTDGITEAENSTEEYYGLERLCRVVSQNWQRSASEVQQAIVADVRSHVGKQKVYDDMTLLVMKQRGEDKG